MKIPRRPLSSVRAQEIADLAEAVADEFCPTGKIHPVAIANHKSITLSFNYYGDAFDGLLEHRAGRFHIYANLDRIERADSPRGRFTLGHELGHYFIDEHRNALRAGLVPSHPSQCEYESDLLVEREADHFASNLLMPPTRYRQVATAARVGLEGVLKVSSLFDTSVTSTAIRYATSDIVPCAVIKWNVEGFAWKWLSTETFRARFQKTIETVEHLAPGSPTARILAGEAPDSGTFLEAGTTAAAWFPFVRDGDARNVILIEQAMSLGRFGAITFLYPESGDWLTPGLSRK